MSTYDLLLDNIESVLSDLMKSADKAQYSNIALLIECLEMIKD